MFSRCADRRRLPLSEGKRRGAFVLVMVLALLTLCALCLAGLARRSLDAGQQLAAARTDAQRRWGIVSCERTYLPLAKDLLEAAAAKLPVESRVWPMPASAAVEFSLGELRFSVLLADEDAKANLNTICRNGPDGPHAVASLVDDLTAGLDGQAVHVQPAANSDNAKPGGGDFRNWGQVFEPPGTSAPGEFAARLRDATREITCWGSGRLNIERASDEAIRLVCANQVTPDLLGKLLSRRHDPGLTGLEALLDGLGLRSSDRTTLERLLTDHSSHYSLWILVRSPQRTWATLAIGNGNSSQGARETFSW